MCIPSGAGADNPVASFMDKQCVCSGFSYITICTICTNLIANGAIGKEIGANGKNGNTIGTNGTNVTNQWYH